MNLTIETSTAVEATLISTLSEQTPGLLELSAALHADPETAFNEHRSVARVAQMLQASNFETKIGEWNLPTSLYASYGNGSLTVGICAEYDALPEIGHACGHNIIASAAVGAALALAQVAEELDLRVLLLGTPAEEDGGGKVLMLEAGAFDQVDFAIMVHPCPQQDVNVSGTSSQGCDRFAVNFTGTAAHAAAAPSYGVNAGNAATVAQVAIGLLRQQLPDGVRINALSRTGGSVINVIPAQASLEIEVRAHEAGIQEDVKAKVLRACEGAAMTAGCELSWEQLAPPYLPVKHHEAILAYWNRALSSTGRTLIDLPPGTSGGGSTDMGNVSQRLPAIHPVIAVLDAIGMPHTAAFASETKSPGADQAVLDAAFALAATAVGVATDGALREELITARTAR